MKRRGTKRRRSAKSTMSPKKKSKFPPASETAGEILKNEAIRFSLLTSYAYVDMKDATIDPNDYNTATTTKASPAQTTSPDTNNRRSKTRNTPTAAVVSTGIRTRNSSKKMVVIDLVNSTDDENQVTADKENETKLQGSNKASSKRNTRNSKNLDKPVSHKKLKPNKVTPSRRSSRKEEKTPKPSRIQTDLPEPDSDSESAKNLATSTTSSQNDSNEAQESEEYLVEKDQDSEEVSDEKALDSEEVSNENALDSEEESNEKAPDSEEVSNEKAQDSEEDSSERIQDSVDNQNENDQNSEGDLNEKAQNSEGELNEATENSEDQNDLRIGSKPNDDTEDSEGEQVETVQIDESSNDNETEEEHHKGNDTEEENEEIDSQESVDLLKGTLKSTPEAMDVDEEESDSLKLVEEEGASENNDADMSPKSNEKHAADKKLKDDTISLIRNFYGDSSLDKGSNSERSDVSTPTRLESDASDNGEKVVKSRKSHTPFKIRFSKGFDYSKHTQHNCSSCDIFFRSNVDLQLHCLRHLDTRNTTVRVFRAVLPETYDTSTNDMEKYLRPKKKPPVTELDVDGAKSLIGKYCKDESLLQPFDNVIEGDVSQSILSQSTLAEDDDCAETTEANVTVLSDITVVPKEKPQHVEIDAEQLGSSGSAECEDNEVTLVAGDVTEIVSDSEDMASGDETEIMDTEVEEVSAKKDDDVEEVMEKEDKDEDVIEVNSNVDDDIEEVMEKDDKDDDIEEVIEKDDDIEEVMEKDDVIEEVMEKDDDIEEVMEKDDKDEDVIEVNPNIDDDIVEVELQISETEGTEFIPETQPEDISNDTEIILVEDIPNKPIRKDEPTVLPGCSGLKRARNDSDDECEISKKMKQLHEGDAPSPNVRLNTSDATDATDFADCEEVHSSPAKAVDDPVLNTQTTEYGTPTASPSKCSDISEGECPMQFQRLANLDQQLLNILDEQKNTESIDTEVSMDNTLTEVDISAHNNNVD